MTYEEALHIVESRKNQPNRIDSNGFSYDDIIIVPTNPQQQKIFFQAFMQNQDAQSAIVPFMHEDVSVWAIETKHMNDAGVLFYENLTK